MVQIFFKVSGGSTALVALFICDRVFVANAGDSRAVVYKHENQFTVTDTLQLILKRRVMLFRLALCLQTSPQLRKGEGSKRSPLTGLLGFLSIDTVALLDQTF